MALMLWAHDEKQVIIIIIINKQVKKINFMTPPT
jgi:hypothetical protein